VDSADVVGRLYASVLLEDSSHELQSLSVDIVLKRKAAIQVLVEGYAEYAATTPGDVALGPAVAAGAVTEAAWQQVAGRLTDPGYLYRAGDRGVHSRSGPLR